MPFFVGICCCTCAVVIIVGLLQNEKLFVYCGNDAPLGEVTDCMIMADRFLAKSGSKTTPIVRVKEGQNVNDEVYDKCFGITKAAGKSAGGGGAAAPAFGQHMLQKKKKAPRQAGKALHSGTLFKKDVGCTAIAD